jgi:dolichyl-phosphate beta-glucosyltransferase
MPEYSIILPAYNEAANIERAIRETAAVFGPLESYEIIVIDDGSRDRTAAIAAALPVRLLRHEVNRGKGTAVRTGVMNAQGEYLLFLDCDLATHPREAVKFIEKINEADIIIGSRRVEGSQIAKPQPLYRSIFGRIINFSVRHLLKLPYRDTQCGFKMFRREAARRIFKDIGPSRWTFDIEILLRAKGLGYKVIELPVTWINGAMSRVRVGEVISDLIYLWKLKKILPRGGVDTTLDIHLE